MSRGITRVSGVGKPDASFYPSPFFDIAQNYIPRTLRETFPWCAYYQQSSPLIATVTQRLSAYPVTDIYYAESEAIAKPFKDFFERKNLRVFIQEANLDRATFGNCFVSIAFPFVKKLACRSCREFKPADKWNYTWRECQFYAECPSCGRADHLEVRDEYVRNAEKIRLVRWPAESLTPDYNVVTGSLEWFYAIPDSFKTEIKAGIRRVIEQAPQTYIEAVRLNMTVKILPEKLFHMRRASISRNSADAVLGTPLILPVLKDLFLVQVMKKSQEVICMEHIIPMRVLYPQITTDGNNVYQFVNIQKWQTEAQSHIGKWKNDPNYMPVMSAPLGYQSIGGQGKAYLLNPDIRMYNEIIASGMGIPISFLYGDTHYSGASVNLKALENEFLGMREDQLRLVIWLHREVGMYMQWEPVEPKQRPFRMADDLQRMNFDAQLVAQKLKSRRSFMASLDMDVEREDERIREETEQQLADQQENMLHQAETNAQVMLIQTQAQIAANKAMANAGMAPQPGQPVPEGGALQEPPEEALPPPDAPPPDIAAEQQNTQDGISLARSLAGMSAVDRYNAVEQLRVSNPRLASAVDLALIQSGVDMRPLPEQRVSRRA